MTSNLLKKTYTFYSVYDIGLKMYNSGFSSSRDKNNNEHIIIIVIARFNIDTKLLNKTLNV